MQMRTSDAMVETEATASGRAHRGVDAELVEEARLTLYVRGALRLSSRQIVQRCRPRKRAISDWLKPCILSLEIMYRSSEVSW